MATRQRSTSTFSEEFSRPVARVALYARVSTLNNQPACSSQDWAPRWLAEAGATP